MESVTSARGLDNLGMLHCRLSLVSTQLWFVPLLYNLRENLAHGIAFDRNIFRVSVVIIIMIYSLLNPWQRRP